MKILIKSAKIIDQNSSFHQQICDILVENNKIVNIAKSIKNTNAIEEITYPNLHVSTGWFDSSVSLGEPGYEEWETIAHGTEVAAKSGFTAIALNANTKPYIDHKSTVEFIVNKNIKSAVNIYPIANLTQHAEGKELA